MRFYSALVLIMRRFKRLSMTYRRPSDEHIFHIVQWSTLSKAALKSMNVINVGLLYRHRCSSIRRSVKIWSLQPGFGLKPAWFSLAYSSYVGPSQAMMILSQILKTTFRSELPR